jgi:hypothetical protein
MAVSTRLRARVISSSRFAQYFVGLSVERQRGVKITPAFGADSEVVKQNIRVGSDIARFTPEFAGAIHSSECASFSSIYLFIELD